LFFAVIAVPSTLAASNPAIADCLAHPGGLTGSYTVKQLQHALQVMPAETKEYTDCSDVLNRALLAAVGKSHGNGSGTGGGSGSFLPTPVIIVLVVLVLAAVTFGAVAIRRRRSGDGDDRDGGDGDDRAGDAGDGPTDG
jgi:hypothetical protein